ncbi:MAG: hypothetical protein FD181_3503 [Prolixibacteraceae bacterium]|nr:MAG: hypothetical protein FD181_3503 [Prolixibacteraceae bacterium]
MNNGETIKYRKMTSAYYLFGKNGLNFIVPDGQ